ncbi:excinuclease ABC subunit A [Gallibacterium trehalosifermentans]|uniref:Excinuclease ABC subunit A n=1 Tax=Gallibacterium trehalosifermentans TaxID=516935 RepID=A0ABV6H101_9PAST
MKLNKAILLLMGVGMLFSANSFARDTTYHLPIKDVLNLPEAKEKLDPTIKFYFGQSVAGSVVKTASTNKKTNAFNKSDEKACQWAMLSAMLQMQERAKQLGVKKISNIVSYYKKNPYKSTTTYECHAGSVMAGVALKGDFVK